MILWTLANAILSALSTGFGCGRAAGKWHGARNIVAVAVVFPGFRDARMSKRQ
jgi:hypothetical protein